MGFFRNTFLNFYKTSYEHFLGHFSRISSEMLSTNLSENQNPPGHGATRFFFRKSSSQIVPNYPSKFLPLISLEIALVIPLGFIYEIFSLFCTSIS